MGPPRYDSQGPRARKRLPCPELTEATTPRRNLVVPGRGTPRVSPGAVLEGRVPVGPGNPTAWWIGGRQVGADSACHPGNQHPGRSVGEVISLPAGRANPRGGPRSPPPPGRRASRRMLRTPLPGPGAAVTPTRPPKTPVASGAICPVGPVGTDLPKKVPRPHQGASSTGALRMTPRPAGQPQRARERRRDLPVPPCGPLPCQPHQVARVGWARGDRGHQRAPAVASRQVAPCRSRTADPRPLLQSRLDLNRAPAESAPLGPCVPTAGRGRFAVDDAEQVSRGRR
jgi:hypothetical protein